jgi:hypothetical protein
MCDVEIVSIIKFDILSWIIPLYEFMSVASICPHVCVVHVVLVDVAIATFILVAPMYAAYASYVVVVLF